VRSDVMPMPVCRSPSVPIARPQALMCDASTATASSR